MEASDAREGASRGRPLAAAEGPVVGRGAPTDPEAVEERAVALARRAIPAAAFPHVRARCTPGEPVALVVRFALPDPGRAVGSRHRLALLRQAVAPHERGRDRLMGELTALASGGRVQLVFEFTEGDVRIVHTSPATASVTARLPVAQVAVLDLLVGAGIAPTRTAAIDWCVRRVADRERALLEELRPLAAQRERVRQAFGV